MKSIALAAAIALAATLASPPAGAAVEVTVDAAAGRLPISPYLFGKNGAVRDDEAQLAREAGIRISRESAGNNCTKYNWREDLSSHPDWYNNVYKQGWAERARKLQDEYPGMQGLFGFQVLGWVARTDAANFREWEADPKPERHENLCGGGDPTLYLQPWTARDTVDILDHWFGPGGLGLDPARFRYWHMDNEPECWASTHDDVSPKDLSAEECVQRYVAVAREVKTRYPGIRLMAPGFTSEWMWWNWNNGFVDGLPWMEYFIKRIAEESQAFGKPLIDVVDFHTYVGGEASDEDALQEHRMLYDPDYRFPRANGCKRFPDGGWHDDQTVERLFGRTEEWLDKYFGPDHGITLGITEAAGPSRDEMINALWYASMLGTFADHGIEVFTPWDWRESWWEVVHLFSRYAREFRVGAQSSDEPQLSAYASINGAGTGMTVILVNRAATRQTVTVRALGFACTGPVQALQLAALPPGERTFRSRTDNALVSSAVTRRGGDLSVEVPARSITALVASGAASD